MLGKRIKNSYGMYVSIFVYVRVCVVIIYLESNGLANFTDSLIKISLTCSKSLVIP